MTTDHGADARLRRLAAVIATPVNEADCLRCLDQLEAYIDVQLAGDDYRAALSDVASHLDQCVACAESYALVYDVRRNEAALLLPAAIPAPSLAFLGRAGAPANRLGAALRTALKVAGQRLTVRLSREMLALLPPPQSPALALRSLDAAPLLTVEFDQPAPAVTSLHLSAHRHPPASELALLRVQVALNDRAWPDLAGIAVHLELGAERRQALTDAWGEAVFTDIADHQLAELAVTIETP